MNAKEDLTRRDLLKLSAAGASALGTTLVFPTWVSGATEQQALPALPNQTQAPTNLYAELLQTWCDGLLARQQTAIHEPALYGGLLCPACALIHGRCGDAVYPLLRMARTTGDSKYVQAALRVHQWSEKQVSRSDGSWVNDVTLSQWKGITVFHAIALAEALHHHGELLDADVRRQWTDRLARASKFLDGFLSIETGNINYPITGSFCFAICGQVLEEPRYVDRGRQLAHTALDYFTSNHLLFGEGHPLTSVSPKKCRPVDLGYNVEESLLSLALYALVTNDKQVLDQVVAALRAHMEFMLPDGAWDNSWGSRNYKWSWWGSRTSDGCHPAYVLLAQHEPRFREAAWRNLQLMSACTHNGLLYGGPHYFAHGDLPCIHHTFTHAKALATVLDRGGSDLEPRPRLSLPRDEAYGLKSYPEIGTRLVSIGDWRGTVTENDWEYVEHVQSGGGSAGGHVTGGALSILFHRRLGPILTASMTQYQTIEISNQQVHGDYPHMELTPRLEWAVDNQIYTSFCDLQGVAGLTQTPEQISFDVHGRFSTAAHKRLANAYRLAYHFTAQNMVIAVGPFVADVGAARLIVPVISAHDEQIERVDVQTVRIFKKDGKLLVHTDAPRGFDTSSHERTFNLVPGFECLPLTVTPQPDKAIHVEFSAEA